ncbi:MAG TPA: TlpA disulfide reductase family protein [Candidatus Polarisedimenticolia bacterium]|nr:TlpA disulfide reductase family protein [Candidatus Polarisedimenticolia bacterium]
MSPHAMHNRIPWIAAALIVASAALAQAPTPSPTPILLTPVRGDSSFTPTPITLTPVPAPTPPAASPVSGIRNKIAAGDLLSAESILAVYREGHGEDIRYCQGLGWLARGALLLGDHEKARRYVKDLRARCADSLANGARFEDDSDLPVVLGAAIEVDAQLIQREKGAAAAAAALKADLDRLQGPVSLRSRVNKRLNMISLAGTRAPELEVDDWIGTKPPTLASLQGKPVLLFLWAEWCGDCRAQAASLAVIKSRHKAEGLEVVALSRYYEKTAEKRPAEKARADSVWKADYSRIGPIPMVLSTASMERYGGSSTPTFVFVDRKGIVRDYTPTRLTELEFELRLASILK